MKPGVTRLLFGLFLAPAVVVPVTFTGYIVLYVLRIDGFRGDLLALWPAATNFAAAALVVAYVAQALAGAPITLLLVRRGHFTLRTMTFLGGICGALPFVIAHLITRWIGHSGRPDMSAFLFAAIGSALGAAIGASTYGIGRGRTPA